MKKKDIWLIILILLCNIGIIRAQRVSEGGHLEPVRGIYDIYDYQFKYYSQVRKILFNGLTEPQIRFLMMPSFYPENVLDIEFDGSKNKYYIIYHICEEIIWYNRDNLENIKVIKFKSEIDEESVKLIKSLFGIAIAQSKFPPTVEEGGPFTIGTDGTTYYFTINEYGYGIKSGQIWSPKDGTKMGKLVAIGEELIELATSKKEIVKIDEKLQQKIEKLIDELK